MKTSSLLAVLACVVAAPVLAQQPAGSRITVSEPVHVADLDLSHAAGHSTLRARLRHAAFAACGEASPADLRGRNEVRRCRAASLRLAFDQVERALAAASSVRPAGRFAQVRSEAAASPRNPD